MIALAVAMGIGRFVYTPILPNMVAALGLTASDAGLIASANYAGYLFGAAVAAGGWAEGRQRALVLSALAASALLAALMGLVSSMVPFVVIRFAAGAASAFVMVFLSTMVLARFADAGRSELQALHFGGVGLGIAASAVITGTDHLVGAGWRADWVWSGIVTLAGFMAVWLMVEPAPRYAEASAREPPIPKDPALRRVILAYGFFGFGYIVTATFLVAVVRDGQAGPLFESTVWLATGLAGLPSVWLWGKVAARFGLVKTFVMSSFVEAAGVVASVALGGLVGPLLGGVLLGGTFIALTALGLQMGRELSGGAPRRVFAVMTAAFGTGQILGPIAAGYLADMTGSFVVPSVGAGLVLLLSALLAWSAGSKRKPDLAPSS